MSFFSELKRRNVFKVATAYAVVSWLILQVADTVFPALGFPDWTLSFITVLLLLGFPIACVLSWAFELTPDGILREGEVDEEKSITHSTGRKIDFIIIGALVLIISGMFYTGTFFVSETADEPVAIAAADKSVAVLPFVDMSEAGDQEWFSDGLTDEILNSLTMLAELKVTARTSAFYFKDQNIAISEIAEQLGVVHVVEGSVRRAGDTLRITAQLIRAEDGFHLWSQTYDRPADDVFDVQRDVAENIARSLDIVLDDERREEMFSTGTTNLEAFEAYQKAGELSSAVHSNRSNGKTMWDVNALYDQALVADPNFASALMSKQDGIGHYLAGDFQWSPEREYLTREAAIKAADDNYDQAIRLAKTEKRRVLYQFNKTFSSDNWQGLPALIEKIKQDLDYYNRSTVIEGFAALGDIDSLGTMAQQRYERNPFNQINWYYLLGYHLNQRDCPTLLELTQEGNRIFGNNSLDWYNVMCQYLSGNQQGLKEWTTENFNLNNLNNSPALATQLFILAINAEDRKIDEYLLPLTEYGTFAGWMMQVYKIMGDQDAVNEAASAFDNNMINTQNFWGPAILANGGILPFQMQYAPNYVRKLRQAGLTEEKIRSMFMADD